MTQNDPGMASGKDFAVAPIYIILLAAMISSGCSRKAPDEIPDVPAGIVSSVISSGISSIISSGGSPDIVSSIASLGIMEASKEFRFMECSKNTRLCTFKDFDVDSVTVRYFSDERHSDQIHEYTPENMSVTVNDFFQKAMYWLNAIYRATGPVYPALETDGGRKAAAAHKILNDILEGYFKETDSYKDIRFMECSKNPGPCTLEDIGVRLVVTHFRTADGYLVQEKYTHKNMAYGYLVPIKYTQENMNGTLNDLVEQVIIYWKKAAAASEKPAYPQVEFFGRKSDEAKKLLWDILAVRIKEMPTY